MLNISQPIVQVGFTSAPLILACDPTIGTLTLATVGIASNAISIFVPTISDVIKQKRLEQVIEIINEHEIPMQKVFENDQSLSNIIAALESTSNTIREDKINYIANLICNSVLNNTIYEENDVFEMKLKILDEISYDEINLLEALHKNYVNIPEDPGNHPDEFKNAIDMTMDGISKDTGIPINFIPYRLDKLHGLGICGKDIMLEAVFGLSKTRVHYYSSPLYMELREYIMKIEKE